MLNVKTYFALLLKLILTKCYLIREFSATE